MENRSFDHFLGWLPGADGKQAGLTLRRPLRRRRTHPPPDATSRAAATPTPTTPTRAAGSQFNGGRCDGWLRAGENDAFAIGYYTRADLAVPRPGGAGLDDVRPLLRRDHGRDLPEPLLPARRADRPAAQLAPTIATLPTIWDRLAGRGRHAARYYFSDVPFIALWGTKYLPISHAVRAVPRRRGGRHPARRCPSSTRGSTDEGVRHLRRRPPARRHPRRRGVPQPGLRRRSPPARAGSNTAAGHQLRRVGRLLRPRRPGQRARRRSAATALRGFRVPALVISPLARRRRTSPTTSTTTPRSCKMIEWRWGLRAADAARRRSPQPRRGARLRRAARPGRAAYTVPAVRRRRMRRAEHRPVASAEEWAGAGASSRSTTDGSCPHEPPTAHRRGRASCCGRRCAAAVAGSPRPRPAAGARPRAATPAAAATSRRRATSSSSTSRTRATTRRGAPASAAPYLAQTLRAQGRAARPSTTAPRTTRQPNYIAQICGQGPNPQMQARLPDLLALRRRRHRRRPARPSAAAASSPPASPPLADQLDRAGLTLEGLHGGHGHARAGTRRSARRDDTQKADGRRPVRDPAQPVRLLPLDHRPPGVLRERTSSTCPR